MCRLLCQKRSESTKEFELAGLNIEELKVVFSEKNLKQPLSKNLKMLTEWQFLHRLGA